MTNNCLREENEKAMNYDNTETEKEYTAEEWINFFKWQVDNTPPVLSMLYEEIIRIINGRHFKEVDFDEMNDVFYYIGYIERTLDREYNSFTKEQVESTLKEIIEVIKSEDWVWTAYECSDCGLFYPVKCGSQDLQIPAKKYFEKCPICGGEIGYSPYIDRHMKSKFRPEA